MASSERNSKLGTRAASVSLSFAIFLGLVCAGAVIGIFRSKPLWGYLSAALFFVLAFPLIFGSLGILMLFAAGCCLMATILAIKAMSPETT